MPSDTPATPQVSLWTHTAQEVLDAAGARRSVPTGGSVVGLSGAFAVSLLILALNLTLTKKDPPAELTPLADELRSLQQRLQTLTDADAKLYAAFMKQARQGDATDAEQADLRQQTREVPLQLARELALGLDLARQLHPLVHSSVVSDIQAGAALLHGALQASLFTLTSNLRATDAPEAAAFRQEGQTLTEQAQVAATWLDEQQTIKNH